MRDVIYAARNSNDREDFIEDKIQIAELVDLGIDFVKYKRDMDVTDKIVVGHGMGRLGFNGEPAWPRLKQKKKADQYHATKTFRNFAKRKFKIVPFTDEAIEKAAAKIGGTVLVKYAGAQKITPIFLIDTQFDIKSQIMDNCGWEMVRVGGEDRQVIVQQQVQMRYEYRILRKSKRF